MLGVNDDDFDQDESESLAAKGGSGSGGGGKGKPTPPDPFVVDLRLTGNDGPVKNQKSCGSCWAFAAIAALEGAVSLKHTISPPDLSEKQLVDCTYARSGCNGGWMYTAYDYLRDFGSTYDEASWPYPLDGSFPYYYGSCPAPPATGNVAEARVTGRRNV